MEDLLVALPPDTFELLERRAHLLGRTSEEYAGAVLADVLNAFEVQDSTENAFRRRLADLRGAKAPA